MQTTAPGKLLVKPSAAATAVSACKQKHYNIIQHILASVSSSSSTVITSTKKKWYYFWEYCSFAHMGL